MRTYLFILVYPGVLFLVTYAWKDWFPAVGGLALMTAVLNNPEMPRQVLGIRGLNLWNLMLLLIVPAWIAGRRREGLRWDLPPLAGVMLALYVLVMVIGFLRLALAPGPVTLSTSELVGECLINPLKYLIPGLMIFDGARTRPRFLLAVASILAVYVFVSILVLREVDVSLLAGGSSLNDWGLQAGLVTGFHRNGVSVMLAGASWALLCIRPLASSRVRSMVLLAIAGLVVFAQALTGGRGGYLAWIGVGLVLSLLRWRGALVVAPIVVSIVLTAVPSVRERALYGISLSEQDAATGPIDEEKLSSGRLEVWGYMVAKVRESPLVGFGRLGYHRSGLHAFLWAKTHAFPHPHNAYLEWLLDNGWLGMAPLMVLNGLVLLLSLILFTDSRHPAFVAAGGMAFSLVLAQVVGSISGRSWYPNEETAGMWCAVGLMLRVWVERSRGSASGAP
jgi:O-antigen ligase